MIVCFFYYLRNLILLEAQQTDTAAAIISLKGYLHVIYPGSGAGVNQVGIEGFFLFVVCTCDDLMVPVVQVNNHSASINLLITSDNDVGGSFREYIGVFCHIRFLHRCVEGLDKCVGVKF